MGSRIIRALLLFALAMAGVATAIINAEIPQEILDQTGLSRQTLLIVSFANNAVLVGIAVLVGALLAHRLGFVSLIAHRVEDASKRLSAFPIYIALGLALGVGVAFADSWAFANIAALKDFTATNMAQMETTAPTLLMRFLYGGITEEVLLRWGVLSLFAWLIWLVIRKQGTAVTLAIIIAALLFGVGHLPTLFSSFEQIPTIMIVRVIALNAILGIAYGAAYARNSLEAGMVAHAATHAGMLLSAQFMGL